jgi:hypothetical protein
MKKDSSQNPAITAAVITGVLGLIGVICAALISIIPELTDNKPLPTSSAAPTETVQLLTPSPTDTPSPTAVIPTDTAQPIDPTATEPGANELPQGYVLYDDFVSENSLNDNWLIDDKRKICQFAARSGYLFFDCNNKAKENLQASLQASQRFVSISGAASLVSVIEAGGPLQLFTRWKCPDENIERSYHIFLSTETATASEFYPLEAWREVSLGILPVALGQAHLLQVEAVGGQVKFLVDGQPIPLNTTPDFSTCLLMDSWGFDFVVWKDNNSILGQAEWVGVKP